MKNYEKILYLLLALSIVLTLTSCEQKLDGNSSSPEDFTWVAVSGGVCITEYHGNATHIVIPSIIDNKKVVDLSPTVFSGNVTIESVVLSEYMSFFDGEDFQGCDSLTSISAPGANGINISNEFPALTTLILPAVQQFSSYDVRLCPSLQILDLSGCNRISCINVWPNSLEKVIIPDWLSYYAPDGWPVLCTQEYAELYNHGQFIPPYLPITDPVEAYHTMFPETVTVVVGDKRY